MYRKPFENIAENGENAGNQSIVSIDPFQNLSKKFISGVSEWLSNTFH